MIISYKMKNFCSFAEIAEFDMLAPNNKVKNRFPDNYVKTEQGYDILKTAVIIGENAGGKSNFINSLQFFKNLFEDNRSKRAIRNFININNLNSVNSTEDDTKQSFDIKVLADSGTIYHYEVDIDALSIVRERFSFCSEKTEKEKVILKVERTTVTKNEETKTIDGVFTVGIDNCDDKIQEILGDKISSKNDIGLFITKLAILGEEHALEFIDWVNNKLNVECLPFNYYIYKNMQQGEDDLRILHDERFLEILRMIDYSIDRIDVDDEKPFRDTKIIRKMKNGEEFFRELKSDSAGVSEFFAWAVQIFRVVFENKIIVADEMDRVINPILAEKMIAFINSKAHKGQFIFSTHNVLHLDLKNYMKEQIYFVTKARSDLNSELYSLADFPEVRYETTKIYEFYMKGILGGTAFE